MDVADVYMFFSLDEKMVILHAKNEPAIILGDCLWMDVSLQNTEISVVRKCVINQQPGCLYSTIAELFQKYSARA